MLSNPTSQLVCGLCLLSIDITISFLCILLHGNNISFSNFTSQFTTFSFFTSTLDILVLAFIRSILWLLPAILYRYGTQMKHIQIIKNITSCLALIMYSYSPTKVLFLAESKFDEEIMFKGDWIIVIWNAIASIILHITWKYYFSKAPSSYIVLDEDNENDIESNTKTTYQVLYQLMQYCNREWIWQVSGFVWMIVNILTKILVPYYIGQVMATIIETKSYSSLTTAVYVMALISFISAFSSGVREGSYVYAFSRVYTSIRYDLFSSLLHQDVAFFDAHKTGEIGSRLGADCQVILDTMANNMNYIIRNVVMISGTVIFMFTLSWRLALVTFILVPISFIVTEISGYYHDILAEKSQEFVAYSNDVSEEVISTMRTIRSFAGEDLEGDRFYHVLTELLKIIEKKTYVYIVFEIVIEFFQTLNIVALLWYGGHLVLQKHLKGELLLSFLIYQIQVAESLRQVLEVWAGLMQTIGSSRKAFEYINIEPTIKQLGTSQPDHLQGHIEFRDVHFSYPTRKNNPILKGVSFTVQPGETVALVGPSGSGKSSCISLLENFYQPISGQILIDGIPLHDYDYHYIHRKIALVGQEPALFAQSVMENIRYGCEDKTETDCVNAAVMANAHNFIMDCTDTYDTNVGEKGCQISGGQKQRIAIARAIIRNPAVLLLDEATSALDTESEALVQNAIYKNLEGKSVIMIAHRLSTVKKADKIIVINKGIVEQIGTHQQLVSQPGTYATLVQHQRLGDNEKSDNLLY